MFLLCLPFSKADHEHRTRSFESLMYHPTTLGMEASPDSRRTPLQPEGLCVRPLLFSEFSKLIFAQNGVIIAQNGSEFLQRWRAMYETFDEGNWAGHSVVMPWVRFSSSSRRRSS